MPNVDEIARQMAATGMLPVDRNSQSSNDNSGQKSQFEQMLAMLAMSNKMNPQTLGGFLLGQILGGGLKSWTENYTDRGDRKAREKIQNGIAQQPPAQPQATSPAPQQPDTAGINPDTTGRLARGLFGGDNPLTNAATSQFENLPEVTSPFQTPNEYDWNQYADILRALQRR